MTRVLLLADGPAMACRVLRTAARAGAAVFVFGEPRARALGISRFCRGLTVAAGRFDASDAGPMIAEINDRIAALGIDMVLAGDPVSSRFLVAARDSLAAPAFPGPDQATFDLLNDKWRFTELARSLGFTCPVTRLLPDRGAVAEAFAAGTLPAPAIVKPLDGSGGVGVFKIEARTAAGQIARIDYAPVLCQDFVSGLDVDVTVYCEAGVVLSFVAWRRERGVYYFHDIASIRRQLETLAAHLNLTGIYNFDIVTDARFEVVHWLECNPRVFFSIDVAAFVGMNYIACGLPGATAVDTAARHGRALSAIAGRRLRKWNALAVNTLRLGAFSVLDWKFLFHSLADLGPVLAGVARKGRHHRHHAQAPHPRAG